MTVKKLPAKMEVLQKKLAEIENSYKINDHAKGIVSTKVNSLVTQDEVLVGIKNSLNMANVSGVAYSKVVSLAKELEHDKVPLQGDSLFSEFTQLNVFLRGLSAAENTKRLLSIGNSIEEGTKELDEFKKDVNMFLARVAKLTLPILQQQEKLFTAALEEEVAAYEALIENRRIKPKLKEVK